MSGESLDRSKIRPEHLERAAFVYVRQSSLKQVRENVESQRRQYAFAEQARSLGWSEGQVVILDEDQGRSGAAPQARPGFARLVGAVARTEVGIVMSLECPFARLWCPICRTSVLCPFSCRGRNFCPSCEKKKQLLWAEWLQEDVLAPVPHRHVVLTMPRLLRGIFRKRRELLLDLSQCAAEALAEYMRRHLAAHSRPGIVVSINTSGDLMQWHPHGHLLSSDGAFSDDGTFHPLEVWDGEAVMKLFRERLLARLIERHAISQELARKLLKWRHPGFSAHIGEPMAVEDKKALEDVASYLVKAPLSLKKLVYLDGQKAVVYRSKMNPALGTGVERGARSEGRSCRPGGCRPAISRFPVALPSSRGCRHLRAPAVSPSLSLRRRRARGAALVLKFLL